MSNDEAPSVLEYDFKETDQKLGNLELLLVAQAVESSGTSEYLKDLKSDLNAVCRRIVETRRVWDLAERIAGVLARFQSREAREKRILQKRYRRLSVMRWSLFLALKRARVTDWFRRGAR